MNKDFVFSIKGKLTILIFLIIVLIIGFASYVLIQSNFSKDYFNKLYKHNEPTFTLTFSVLSNLNSVLAIVNYSAFIKDTVGHRNLIETCNSLIHTHEIIKNHVDTLGLLDDKAIAVDLKFLESYNNLQFATNEYYKILEEYRYQNKVLNEPIDTVIKTYLNQKITPLYWDLFSKHFEFYDLYAQNKEDNMHTLLSHSSRMLIIIIILSLLIISFSYILWRNLYKYIEQGINSLIEHISLISEGKLIKKEHFENDEIGQIYQSTNVMVDNLTKASIFASEIGKGNFVSNFKPKSEEDTLGHSLISMRNELQKFKYEDEKRLWTNKGLAKFAEIIRQNDNNLSELGDRFLANLIEYVDANQGALYTLDNFDKNDSTLNQIACYAHVKQINTEEKIEIGEGFVGQVFKEKEFLLLTEIPEKYIKIASGLGESLPRTLLFVPIKVEEKVLGVIELASFGLFEKYQIEFIEKISESLASTLISVLNKDKMKILLDELQEKSEQMHSQEEELRQNMEELMATQEEINRKEIDREKELKNLKDENIKLKVQLEKFLNS